MCLVVDFMNDDVAHNSRRRLERWYCEFIQKGVVFGICLGVRNQSTLAQNVILLLKSLLLLDGRERGKAVLTNVCCRKRLLVDTESVDVDVCTLWGNDDSACLLHASYCLPEGVVVRVNKLTADDTVDEYTHIVHALTVEVRHDVDGYMGTCLLRVSPVLRTVHTLLHCHHATLLCLQPETYQVFIGGGWCAHLEEDSVLVCHISGSEVHLNGQSLQRCVVGISIVVDVHL